jgi:3-oxoacyl-[acyl-carrier protein] reductase
MGVLDERVAIVTGSARGIGRATAELLSEHGANVVISDLDSDAVRETADAIGPETAVHAGDLTRPGEPERLITAATDAWGRVDIIVNNAGYAWDGVAHKTTDEQFQAMLDIHVVAPFRILRAAAPFLREPAKQEFAEGREVFRKVVNVTSTSGVMGNVGQVNYAAGKAAIVGLTKSLAKEWGAFKVNVNAVAFGFIETRLTAAMVDSNVITIEGRPVQLGVPDAVREMARELIPLGRPGTPREAAGGVFFLCAPWSNFITGQVLNITGGQTSGMSS